VLHVALFLVIGLSVPWAASRFAARSPDAFEFIAFAAVVTLGVWVALSGLGSKDSLAAWWRLALLTGSVYAASFAVVGPAVADAHSARDLAGYLNRVSRVPDTVYVMDMRMSFVFYLSRERRRELSAPGRVRNVGVQELEDLRPFPAGAVVALPADLARRLDSVPGLAGGRRERAGRYVVAFPPPFQPPDG
jgi:hypothetical protein